MLMKNNHRVTMKDEDGCKTVYLNGKRIVKYSPTSRHVHFDTHGNFSPVTRQQMNLAMLRNELPIRIIATATHWYVENTKLKTIRQFSASECFIGT